MATRWALRLFLVALIVAMGLPRLKAAYVAVTLSGTIASRGVEEAVKQYHRLKLAETTAPDGVLWARWSVYD